MKNIIILILLNAGYVFNLMAQSTQDFLESCIKEERIKGAKGIIIRTNLCSFCMGEPIFEGRLFIMDSTDIYKVRYLKYVNGYESITVLKDSTYLDSDVGDIFKIVEIYQDSIFKQLKNMDSLLTEYVVYKGHICLSLPIMEGIMRYVGLFYGNQIIFTIDSIGYSVNSTFKKAYYYWLLNSLINNYINEHSSNKVYK